MDSWDTDTIMADSARLVNRFFIIEPDLLSVSVMQRSAKLSFRLGLHGGMCVSARGDCLGEPPFWAASLHNTLYFTNSQTFAIGYII